MNQLVFWSESAFKDLDKIHDFISISSESKANSLIRNILARTKQLETFPNSGGVYEYTNDSKRVYRYLVEGNYKIIYSVSPIKVYVEAVIDTRMNPESVSI